MEEIAKVVVRDYGVTGLAVLALAYLSYKIGMRVVDAVDRLTTRSDENAKQMTQKADANSATMAQAFSIASKEIALSIATHSATVSTRIGELQTSTSTKVGELSERVARVEAKLDMQDEVTPVSGVPVMPRHRTNG